MLKYKVGAIAILLLLEGLSIAQTPVKLSYKQREGYYVSLDGDTIDAIIKKDPPCELAKKVVIILDDGSGQMVQQVLNPQLIRGFGFENSHYVSAGYESSLEKIYIKSHPMNDHFKVFAKVYYNEGYELISYSEFATRMVYNPYGAFPVTGCHEVGFLKESDNIFRSIKNLKVEVEQLSRHDPVVMELIKGRLRVGLEEAAEFLFRLDQHKKGIYLEDEIKLYEKYKSEIEKIKSRKQVADLLLSELKPLNTSDGVILCRRTLHEDTKALMPYGQEAYSNFRTVERHLSKGMQMYLADSLDAGFKDYIPHIRNGINYIRKKFPDLDASYYQNELQFYEMVLSTRKEE
jgi:hypothetical protein